MTIASDTTVIMEPPRLRCSPEIPAADQTAAQAVIRDLVDKLTPPTDPLERLRYITIAEDLEWLDGHSAAELLDQPVDRFGGAYCQLSAYTLVVLAAAELRSRGLILNGHERLLLIIRQQAHAEFVNLFSYLSTLWLVPATTEERTAASIGSLLLNLGGEACRPWLSSELPDHGHFLIVAPSTTDPVAAQMAARHPFATHHRCEGITHFAHLATHSLAPC